MVLSLSEEEGKNKKKEDLRLIIMERQKSASPKEFLRLMRMLVILDEDRFPLPISSREDYLETLTSLEDTLKSQSILQRSYLEGDEGAKDAIKFHEEWAASVKRIAQDPLNRFPLEDPFLSDLVLYANQNVVTTISREGIALSEVEVGVLPTGHINAEVGPVPIGGYYIAVDAGSILFLALIATILSSLVQIDFSNDSLKLEASTQKIVESLNKNKWVSENFSALLSAYKSGTFSRETIPSDVYNLLFNGLTYGQRFLANMLTYVSLKFVLCHEYSHIILGHLGSGSQTVHIGKEVSLMIQNHDQREEIEADLKAMEITLKTYPPNEEIYRHLVVAGIEFVISIIETVEEFYLQRPSDTHPKASIRRKNLRIWYQNSFPNDLELSNLDFFVDTLVRETWNLAQESS